MGWLTHSVIIFSSSEKYLGHQRMGVKSANAEFICPTLERFYRFKGEDKYVYST